MTTAAIIPVVNLKIFLFGNSAAERGKKKEEKKERKGAAAVKLAKGVAFHQILLLSILMTLLSALEVSSYQL